MAFREYNEMFINKSTSDCFEMDESESEPVTVIKKIKYGRTTFQTAKEMIFEYFNSSSIHGIKYISDPKRSLLDRIIWLSALVGSILVCCYLMANMWNERNGTPVTVTFNEKLTPIWEIPFPSVTICPETKTKTDVFNFTKTLWAITARKYVTKNDQFFWKAISQICPVTDSVWSFYAEKHVNATELNKHLLKMAPTLKDTMVSCLWRGSPVNCSKIFKRVITEDGVCFSFNSLKSNYYRDELKNAKIQDENFYSGSTENVPKWNIDDGYDKTEDINTYPRRVIGSGEKEGLTLLLLSQKKDEDLLCRKSVKGFKVILHTPGEEPNALKNFINVPFEKSVLIFIQPKIVRASEGLSSYATHKRQCYYHTERHLRYFKVYNKANCALECLANRTLERCQCVKFSMPRDSSHLVCGSLNFKCISEAANIVNQLNFNQAKNPPVDESSQCNCLPLCTNVHYKAVLGNQIDFDFIATSIALKYNSIKVDYPGGKFTEVKIHFKDEHFNALKRSELYSDSDFIAKCAGLLGLFMGVSILSLVELVYFFTIKLWANMRTRRITNWQ